MRSSWSDERDLQGTAVSSPRNVQRLIAEWVRLTGHRLRSDPARGYDVRHLRTDIDRERALEEARAAAKLAKDFAASQA